MGGSALSPVSGSIFALGTVPEAPRVGVPPGPGAGSEDQDEGDLSSGVDEDALDADDVDTDQIAERRS